MSKNINEKSIIARLLDNGSEKITIEITKTKGPTDGINIDVIVDNKHADVSMRRDELNNWTSLIIYLIKDRLESIEKHINKNK